jgi:restriction endonuclease S subunit
LGEVAKYRNGKAHENCIDESGKYIVVNSKFVSTNGTVIKHSNMQNEPLAQNEIAFVLSDVPNGRAIARTFLVEENDKYTLNQRIAGITSSENTYPYFLHILMNRHPYFLAFDDGVKQTNLSVSDVLNFETYYPEYEEQKQIGEYFRNLDRLITLHQREFAFLCKEKSKKFRYIKNAWEQRKFDEVFDCTVPNNTLSRAELSYDEGTVLNVHYGDVLIKYGSVLDVQKDDIPRIPYRCREDFNGALLQDGDVIIADTAEDETTGKACEIGNLQGRAIVSGLHTMVCRPRHRMALGYLGHYLNSNAYHHQLLPLMQGIKVLSLSRSNIQKTSVSYPTVEKEQQLIANYFSQLDNLIAPSL